MLENPILQIEPDWDISAQTAPDDRSISAQIGVNGQTGDPDALRMSLCEAQKLGRQGNHGPATPSDRADARNLEISRSVTDVPHWLVWLNVLSPRPV